MQFVIVITGPQAADLPHDVSHELMGEYQRYTQEMKDAGVMKHGEALHDTTRGKRIKVTNGKRVVIDGPFAEAKEVIGGYYQIETKTLDEAVEWAAKCPGARFGTIELREVIVW